MSKLLLQRTMLTLALAAACTLLLPAQAKDVEVLRFESKLQVGVVAAEQVWATELHYPKIEQSGGPWPWAVAVVHFVPIAGDPVCKNRHVQGFFSCRLHDYPWCWRMGQSWFYVVQPVEQGTLGAGGTGGNAMLRMPLDALIHLRAAPKEATVIQPRGFPTDGGVMEKLGIDLRFNDDWSPHFGPMLLSGDFGGPGGPGAVPKTERGPVHHPNVPSYSYDILPTSKTELLAFYHVVQPRGRRKGEQPMEVWLAKELNGTPTWTKRDSFPCHFEEHFHAYVDGRDNYYFVTDSGKAYIARKPFAGERRLEPLWTDKREPIHALIEDAERGKTYAFGREALNSQARNLQPRFFYFELSEKPELHYFDGKDLRIVDAPAAAQNVFMYARLLAEQRALGR